MSLQDTISQALPRFNARPLFSTERDMQFFVDRNDELELLEKAIEHEFNALILGERGSGKTSILNSLAYRLEGNKEGIMTVYVSAMLYSIDTPIKLLQALLTELIKNLEQKPKNTSERLKQTLAQSAEVLSQTIGVSIAPLSMTRTLKKKEDVLSSESFSMMMDSGYKL